MLSDNQHINADEKYFVLFRVFRVFCGLKSLKIDICQIAC